MKRIPTPAGALLALCLAAAPVAAAPAPTDEARTLYEQGCLRRAAALCEQRLAANASDVTANTVLARVRIAQGNVDEAIKLGTAAVTADPKNADAQFALGAAYGRKAQSVSKLTAAGWAGKVKKTGEAALAIDPRHVDAMGLVVDFYQFAPGIMGGDKKKAAEYVERMIQVDPAAGWGKKANLAFSDDDTTRGAQYLAKALEAAPTSTRAQLSLAAYLVAPGRDQARAEKLARQVVEQEPWRMGGWQILAGAYAWQERWADLDDVLAKSEAVDPTRLGPWYTAARTLVTNSKDPARAERYLRHYLSRPPEIGAATHANARWRLGQALEKQGRKDEALAEVSAAVKADPKNEDAKKDLKRLKS